MGGGLLQLVAYGAQDIYLTGNPQITFFKVVYRRHTNFSMESIEQTFNGTADFGKKVSATISRNGDLAHRVYLQTTLPQITVTDLSGTAFRIDADTNVTLGTFKWVNWIGHKMIKYVEVEIGGQRIDKHYGEWLHLWNELTQTATHENTYARMVGNVPKLTTSPYYAVDTSGDTWVIPQTTLYIPLQFWFCRNPGLALPLIALQYHETKINIEFEDLANCIIAKNTSGTDVASSFTGDLALSNTNLWVDYIYLDTDERRRFAQMAHEYLIEQLQYSGEETATSSTNKIPLSFNHPVKELVWITQVKSASDAKQWYNFSMAADDSFDTGLAMDPLGMGLTSPLYHSLGRYAARLRSSTDTGGAHGIDSSLNITFDYGQNPTSVAKLQLNGQDRFTERQGDYFNYVQPYQHHTRGPSIGVNVYSFSLKPEEHQPSGTCNFSRIDKANLFLTLNTTDVKGTTQINAANPAKIRVYATNYNVLRIMSGMGGLAYSN